MSKPKYMIPVKTGDRLDLTVQSQGSSGDGICRHEGYTLFVPSALPGDRVRTEVVKTTPRFGVTRVVERIESSPDRVDPPCPAFPECGGCKFQDLAYEKQLEFKVRTVTDSLKHIGKIDPVPEIKILPAENPYHYRNKGSFAVQFIQGRLRIGFFKQGTHEVVDSDRCDILLPEINEAKEWIRGLLIKHRISIYHESAHKGFFRGMMIRRSESTGEMLIGFITTKGNSPRKFLQEIKDPERLSRFNISGIVQNLNERDTNILLGDRTRALHGQDHLMEELGGLQFRLSLPSFFQVNSAQTLKLYGLVSRWARGAEGRALDAYSGAGGIGLWLGKQGIEVTGIEEVPQAVEDARENARLNGIESCEFLEGRVEDHIGTFAGKKDVTTLILDPPRKGCADKVIQAVPAMAPETIIYISCNPATLARDLERFEGYRIEEIWVVDMFPQTQHIETAVLLKRTPLA